MQLLGKDTIIQSWLGPSGELLHQTSAGFQFGSGKDRKIITGPDQVAMFAESVQKLVSDWLAANGVFEANKEVMDRDIVELAKEQPGSLDAMAEKLGPDVKAQLFQMLQSAIHQTAGPGFSTPPAPATQTDGVHEYVDGKPVVVDAKGFKHPLPDPELVKHPKVIPTPGGILLDKGHGHKEFRLGEDAEGEDDLAEERARIAEQEGRNAPGRKATRATARR